MTDPTDKTPKAGEAMDQMEATLTEMQDNIAGSLAPVRRHFRPWWLLMAILVAVGVGGAAFLGATLLTEVPDNARAIDKNCESRNEQIRLLNEKFDQLNVLFDAALAEPRAPGEPPPSEEILRLYKDFKRPIPPVSCKNLLSQNQGAP